MALWKTKRANTLRVAFPAVRNGVLSTGLLSGVFNVELLSPSGSASTGALTVTQTTAKAGVYYVDVPTSFLTTHGIGHYGLLVEIHKPAPQPIDDVVLMPLEIVDRDLDDLERTVDAAARQASILASIIAAQTTAAAGSTATVIRTGLTQADDFFNNMQVAVVNASGVAVRNIDDFANVNGAITVAALPFTPSVGDVVVVLARTGSVPVNTVAIAAAVWSQALPGAFAAGTAGARLALVDKVLRNKLVTDPVAGTITVFDDDNVTPLVTATLFEDVAGTQTYRGSGADRRDRMT